MSHFVEPKFVVGGEFAFSPAIVFRPRYGQFSDYASRLPGYQRQYTFGAYYSLKAIIAQLKLERSDTVLLPSYLCPSMILPFREAGVKLDFYKMKEGLLPNLEDIDKKLSNSVKAILFVDYFGVSQKEAVAPIMDTFKSQKVLTIQDTVQSWLDNEKTLYADYCVNSVRKYAPFEASILLSKQEVSVEGNRRCMHRFIIHKRWAQILRYFHINYGWFSAHAFLKHIDISNGEYHKEGLASMPEYNRWLLDRIDFASMGKLRRSVYHELQQALSLKTLISSDIGNATPLGMAVYLEDREAKKMELHSRNVHCPVHWRLSEEIDRKEHEFCWDLEQHALTLPVNVPSTQVSKYIKILREVL